MDERDDSRAAAGEGEGPSEVACAASVANPRAACVIVGAGAAGVRAARELGRLDPLRPLVLLGSEPVLPYDRVRLSSLLAGECRVEALDQSADLDSLPQLRLCLGERVTRIDVAARAVHCASGAVFEYGALILALGSRPHVPSIEGTSLAGVYTFRDLRDAEALTARRLRSRHTVVLGGGLLGLEAARAMHRFSTEVTVVEHGGRLMPRQLDEPAARRLSAQVLTQGIACIVDDGAVKLWGDSGSVRHVRLRSGRVLECDTVVIATGIVPNTRLALDAGIPIGRGIKVDDQLRTGAADVYAIGECAEHRGVVYGLAAPCLEQAAVAASVVAGVEARYLGSVDATRLKVMRTQVFAAGMHPERSVAGLDREIAHAGDGAYRRLIHRRGKLLGVLGVGDWDELPRALEAVQHGRSIGWLQRWRFARSGRLWPVSDAGVAGWPANATVCNCTGVTRGKLSGAIASGCGTRAALAACTRASTVCGSCAPLLDQLLGGDARPQPVAGGRPLLVMACMAALAALLLSLLPGLPYVPSWSQFQSHWDVLWRNGLLKQISGYTLAGMALVGLLISLRKRAPRVRWGSFALWRNLHVGLGLGALVAMLAHTGGRLGSGLNAGLMSAFIALVIAGALAGALIAFEHRLSPAQAKRLRGGLTWTHILAFWPLPALLGFHVLKIYYY